MPEHVHVHAPHELGEPGQATTSARAVARDRGRAPALAGDARHRVERVPGREVERAPGPAVHAGEHRAQLRQPRVDARARRTAPRTSSTSTAGSRSTTDGNTKLADLYERRFRDEFRPAFERWLAEDPLHNANAIASPLLEKNYVLANTVKADKLEKLGDVRFEQGKYATEHADDYVFVTVFFAVVLFFAGISLRFAWLPMRLLILAMGAVLLIYGAIRLAHAADALTAARQLSTSATNAVDHHEDAEHDEGIEGQRPLDARRASLDARSSSRSRGAEEDREHHRDPHQHGGDHDVTGGGRDLDLAPTRSRRRWWRRPGR